MPQLTAQRTADLTGRPTSGLTGLTIKAALLLGFGLTVGVWIFAGYYYTRQVDQLDRRRAAISERYLQAQDLLSTARNQVIRASVLIRDALLDSSKPPLRDYPREMEDAYTRAQQALRSYVPVLDDVAEQARVLNLDAEIGKLRAEMLAILGEVRPGLSDAGRVLSNRIMPRREAIIGIAEELQHAPLLGLA